MIYRLFLILPFILSQAAFTQNVPAFSTIRFNPEIMNPAMTGKALQFGLLNRAQWIGQGLPYQSNTIYGSKRIRQGRLGLGGVIRHDQLYQMEELELKVNGNYLLKLNRGLKVWFGMSLGIHSSRNSFGDLRIKDVQDVTIGDGRGTVPVFGVGACIQKGNYYASFAATDINEPSFANNAVSLAVRNRHYYFMSGAHFKINDRKSFVPLILMRYTGFHYPLVDLGGYIEWFNHYWTGAFIRSNGEVGLQVGFDLGKALRSEHQFNLGVSYSDQAFSTLGSLHSGNTEVFIRFVPHKKPDPDEIKQKRKIISPLFF